MNMTPEIPEDQEPKYTLAEAKAIIPTVGGHARLDKYGVLGMSEMAKRSWDKPSVKREAFAIVRKALTAYKSEVVARLKDGWAHCDGCKTLIAEVLRQNVVAKDWNNPFDIEIKCDECLPTHVTKLLSSGFAERIAVAKKASTDPKSIVQIAIRMGG